MKLKLRLPFKGDYAITFPFGATPTNEELKQKFREWGIVGHHGIDYGLPIGTEVVATSAGKVIQSGNNADWGISVTIKHVWGQSIYAHLLSSNVTVGERVTAGKPIGLSGKSGAGLGEHLHFGIKLKNADPNDGYLGFIDSSPYLKR